MASAAVRNFKTASTSREQFAIGSLALAFRLGLADFLPDRLRVEYGDGAMPADVEAYLSGVLGQVVQVGLYIGPPRAVRKPVLQVLDEDGRTIAFAKLGIDAFTDSLVRDEAETVSMLSSVAKTALAIPTVLHHGTWQGHELLVQTAFPRGESASLRSEGVRRAMDELARSQGVRTVAVADSAYWSRLTKRVHSLPRSQFATMLAKSLANIEKSNAGVDLEFGASHGDWAPWNMTVVEGRVLVWDWEKFDSDVPVGFDAAHFDVQGAVVMSGTTPAQAFRDALDRASALLPHAAGSRVAALIVWLYAIDIAVRYLEDGEMTSGATRMSKLSTWLESVLDAAVNTVVTHRR